MAVAVVVAAQKMGAGRGHQHFSFLRDGAALRAVLPHYWPRAA